ncbi:DsbA family protein [Gymnodinialimonas ceratoperidinii]|uniref:DsbA family protein n=1 Tax=Gymnodinialimonas ceratoperidinii TaxID=2856823 RepID=A0A8F6TW92_9RHOB|nr:DsbA family protein [Gymnodinialimonas ceratoperidinii]QXT39830.1 DsbA family protein [Gymnodinialimonas ceratoperidinii]
MDRRAMILGGATGVLGAGAYLVWNGRGGQRFQTEAPLTPFSAANAQEVTELPEVTEMSKGNPDSPVTLIEYASFTCPHCRSFHSNVFPELNRDYIEPGLINFIYREVYFDRYGLWAGMVARCGGPLRYFGIVDLLYQQQGEWTQGSPAEIAENLRRIGRTAGLSNEELDACMTDAAMAEAMIATYEANMEVHEIPGTPAFILNDELHGNMNYTDMSALLDTAIEAAG